jgi:hypothetical protein
MEDFPMVLKTQCEGSLAISHEYIDNLEDLQMYMRYHIRNYRVYNINGKQLKLNWWLIRKSDDVVLAQSKGFHP